MLAAPQGSQTSREGEHTRRNFKFRINEITHINFLLWYLEHRKLSINILYCYYEYLCKGMWKEGCHVAQTRIGSTILGAAHCSSSSVICTLMHFAFSLQHHLERLRGRLGQPQVECLGVIKLEPYQGELLRELGMLSLMQRNWGSVRNCMPAYKNDLN